MKTSTSLCVASIAVSTSIVYVYLDHTLYTLIIFYAAFAIWAWSANIFLLGLAGINTLSLHLLLKNTSQIAVGLSMAAILLSILSTSVDENIVEWIAIAYFAGLTYWVFSDDGLGTGARPSFVRYVVLIMHPVLQTTILFTLL